MKRKLMFILLGIILTIALVSAVFYPEPWGNNQDAGGYDITNLGNVTANNFIGSFVGSVDSVNWTKLKNYPVACPGSGAITLLNDSVTCSDLWVDAAGDTMTGPLNITANLEVNGTVKITGGSPGLGKILTSDANGKATWNLTINDQASSNYTDIGTMRIQWGSESITVDTAVTITLPGAFANTGYAVTTSVDDSWTTSVRVSEVMKVESKTTTTFDLDRDDDVTGTVISDWIAIGLKP